MNKQDVLKLQTCVLKVNVHCEGCKHKVKKQLQKIEGVYSVKADVDQGKVTVTGNVDPAILIKKLSKSGKHAELCGGGGGGGGGGGKGFSNPAAQLNNLNLSGKMVNISKPKGGKDNHQGKGNNGGGGGGHPMQQQQQQMGPQQFQQMMMMKGGHGHGHGGGGGKDMKMPKEQKSVKFADDDEFDDDDFDDDEFDDDEFDDEFDEEDEDEMVGHGHGHNMPKQQMMMPNKMAPVGHGPKGPHEMMMMMNSFNKSGGGAGKKGGGGGGGGGFEIPVQIKGKSGKDGKKGEEKGKTEGKENKGSGGKNGKSESKSGGGLLGFLKRSASGKGDPKKSSKKKEGGGGNKVKSGHSGAGEGHNHNNGPKKGGPKKGNKGGTHGHDMDDLMKQQINKGKPNKGFGGPMGGQMGHGGTMGNFPAVQGLPMNGGGGFYPPPAMANQPPMMSQPMNQQQYMHMMMNQQNHGGGGGYGGDMYQPQMMYARPYPPMNYGHPSSMPPPSHPDSYTHYFSDENTDSCSVM